MIVVFSNKVIPLIINHDTVRTTQLTITIS